MNHPSLKMLIGLSAGVAALVGCGPSTIFTVQTNVGITAANPTTGQFLYGTVPYPGLTAQGIVTGSDGPGTYSGTDSEYNGVTTNMISPPILAAFQVDDLILPASYNHYVWYPFQCASVPTPPVQYSTPYGSEWEYETINYWTTDHVYWVCNKPAPTLTVPSTTFAMSGSVPPSITIPGQNPFSTTYGMPILYLYSGTNGTPSLAATVTASSVVSGGGSATFPLPSSLAAGAYGLVPANATQGGGYMPNGVNLFAVGSSEPQTGVPFGVAVAGITDDWEDRSTCDHGVTSGTYYSTFPVISLYSENEVSVGDYNSGAYDIAVGANPTAVATYSGPTVDQTSSDDCDDYEDRYSGANQAIVTNSGSNTVTLIDLVNEVSLGNVTVGNQPVAVVVSSDGNYAYVANYSDSTVTQIALGSGNATTTAAVGGKPTSVALASNGTLWVGGVGFLTEVNTKNMIVTATETTSETIVALGYSDDVGQIVATTVDSSGNVYADQLNPANVAAGGTYAPLNSVVVSTLGTHLNTRTNAQVQSFTNTLASTSILNINQSGAPPLVVYDAWVAVTATPGGFTITDIADNYVFTSVSTPSPVTAIAIDPYLNVAYLTMPDSNLIWTVPLPGIGVPGT